MSTSTVAPARGRSTSTGSSGADPTTPARRRDHARVPLHRLMWVELTKMVNTRSGFWLLASIGITAVIATGSVIAFAPEVMHTYGNFSAAVGMPIAIILPMVAILAVTSEWSQRTGLTTFTLVPHRGRVLAAKALVTLTIAVVSMGVALAVGALGHLLGAAVNGTGTTWDVDPANIGTIVLGNTLALMMGFTLGVVFRSSPVAIVGYFVFSFVLPNLLFMLGTVQEWFADVQPWVDFYFSYTVLYEDVPTAEQWAQIGTSGLLWLVLPLTIGTWAALRAEVK